MLFRNLKNLNTLGSFEQEKEFHIKEETILIVFFFKLKEIIKMSIACHFLKHGAQLLDKYPK